MKLKFNSLLALLLVASSTLSACASAPSGGKCDGGVCIDLELAEPIRVNEPVQVTITVETQEDVPGLKISLWFSDPDIVVDGESIWVVDAKANVPMQFSTTIRFPRGEGYYRVHAGAQDFVGQLLVQDVARVRMTALGGTLNPPSEGDTRTPPVLPTVPPALLTPSSPLPTPSFPVSTAAPTTSPLDRPTPPASASTPYPVHIVAGRQDLIIPIPEDGTWLTYTFPITSAPPGATVTAGVSARFLVAHPRPQDLIAEVIGPDGMTVYRVWDRQQPTPEDFDERGLVLSAYDITIFDGQPINGDWTLRIRDGRRGKTGTLLALSVAVGYLRPSASRTLPHRREHGRGLLAAQGSWQKITTQTFEGAFPSTGWTVNDLSEDGYERYWDDDDYRPHLGGWAAWPANGGADGIYPSPGNDNYPNNMNTRMIYGPFDLSDAVKADIYFWLWREIEAGYDYLAFEISHDGIAFQERSCLASCRC